MVERARLESVYTVLSCIEGSNPSLSARHKKTPPRGVFLCLTERPGENPLSRSEEGFDKIVRNNFGRTTKGSMPAGQKPGWFLTIPLPWTCYDSLIAKSRH